MRWLIAFLVWRAAASAVPVADRMQSAFDRAREAQSFVGGTFQ